MKAQIKPNMSQRLGKSLGKACAWVRRQEYRLVGWLTAKGLPETAAKVAVAVVNLVAIGVLCYFAFLAALLLAFAIAAACLYQNTDLTSDEEEPQWRDGFGGYGLYRGDVRIDIGDPDDE